MEALAIRILRSRPPATYQVGDVYPVVAEFAESYLIVIPGRLTWELKSYLVHKDDAEVIIEGVTL